MQLPEARSDVWCLVSPGLGSWRSLKVTEGWTDTACNTHTAVAKTRRKWSFWMKQSGRVYFFQANARRHNRGHLLVKYMTHMQTHKHRETQTRGENETSNSSKTTSHLWTHLWNRTQNIPHAFRYDNMCGHGNDTGVRQV